MNMEWDDYEIYQPGVFAPMHTLARREARQAFNRLMAAKPGRIQMLRRLLKANGVELGGTDAAVQDLNDWFRPNVQEDPQKPGRLLPIWYSVVNDIGLFLGDLMIARCLQLRWEFYTWGKKDVSYQRHVIMGFRHVPNPKYNIDIDRLVATYGYRIVAGEDVEEDAFWQWLREVEGRCSPLGGE
jgi:hypothetical protein